jgi:hypothetical protein
VIQYITLQRVWRGNRIQHNARFKPSINYAESERNSTGYCKFRADLGPNLDDGELASESRKFWYLLISHKVCHTRYISHGGGRGGRMMHKLQKEPSVLADVYMV